MSQPQSNRTPARMRRLIHTVKRLAERPGMLAEGEKVVVGVSGGADSLCLLHVLNHLNLRHGKGWQLLPVHVDPGFPDWRADRVLKTCARIGLECTVLKLDVPARLENTSLNPCYVCARERRKALFRVTAELGATKVALAHHMEDVSETMLINLLMTASGSTFIPRQEFFQGKVVLVRPLYYIEKPLIRAYLNYHGLRTVRSHCPMLRRGMRLEVRRFLERLYRRDRRTRTNLFWGIHNLKPEYLPKGNPDPVPDPT